jgi:hypothetical protein
MLQKRGKGGQCINKAAKALVAYEGRDTVTKDKKKEDVGKVTSACLNHRWG